MVHKSRFTCQSHDQITKKLNTNINIAYGGLLSLATTPHLIVQFQGSSSHHNFGREIRVSQNILIVIIKPLLATARVAQCIGAVHLFVCLTVCLSVCRQNAKTRFSQKLSNLELWSLLTTYKKSYIGFSKNPLLDP